MPATQNIFLHKSERERHCGDKESKKGHTAFLVCVKEKCQAYVNSQVVTYERPQDIL